MQISTMSLQQKKATFYIPLQHKILANHIPGMSTAPKCI